MFNLLQAWLAVKGPLLQRAATEDALWSKAMDAIGPSLPSKSAIRTDSAEEEPQYASAGADEVFKTYYAQSKKVDYLMSPKSEERSQEKFLMYSSGSEIQSPVQEISSNAVPKTRNTTMWP